MAAKTVNVTYSIVVNIEVGAADAPTLSNAQAEAEAMRIFEQTPAFQYISKSPHQVQGDVSISAATV